MFYSMVGVCKITQWQHYLVSFQQAGHVEDCFALISYLGNFINFSPED